jgi:hypothetical protein
VTTQNEQPFNVAHEGAYVGVMGKHVDIDKIDVDSATFTGDVQLTVSSDAPPSVKLQAGIDNLTHGDPREARRLIWNVMISKHGGNKALFYWLIAMLSGRTVQQFSKQEISQLRQSRSWYVLTDGDAWADGVRLIYRFLDSALATSADKRKMAEPEMQLLVKQVDALGVTQRDLIRPHLELFLAGHLQDEVWRHELRMARDRQRACGRGGRAWMFFQPVPAEASLPLPQPERVSRGDRLLMRVSACLFAAAGGYLGWGLLRQGNVLGLLSYVAALTGGMVAVAADLEWRFVTERNRQRDELFRLPSEHTPKSADELAAGVDKLFKRYYTNYEADKAERQAWDSATAGIRRFFRDEIIEMCRRSGAQANTMAWLIRHEVRDLKRHWQDGSLHEYRRQQAPQPHTVTAHRAGLAVLALGGVWAVVSLRAHPLAIAVALLGALGTWRYWLRASLEHRRHAADSAERTERQAAIDEEFRRWSKKLEARPSDAEMAAWLARDRTVLLGAALDHFRLPRSQVVAHAFLEHPGVAVKRGRIEGGPWRYGGYRFQAFLLGEDGVRQVRAHLNFVTGTLDIRERTSYPYDSIVAVRFLKELRHQTFELRLTAGDPIIIQLRNTDVAEAQQDQHAEPADETQEAATPDEEVTADATSVADVLHMLERSIAEKKTWFQERDRTGTWPDSDDTR